MKRSLSFIGLAVLAGLNIAGCATIVAGSSQSISVTSNVEDAEIYLDGDQIGTTPFTGMVPKNKEELRVEKEGYRTETVSLSKSLEPIFWGNIITGGTLGSITDFATGAAYQYAPASYQVELQAAGQPDSEYLQQLAVRKFSMIYIDEISQDIVDGEGDYLSALVALVNRNEKVGPEVDGSDVAGALEASGGDPVRFGREVVGLR